MFYNLKNEMNNPERGFMIEQNFPNGSKKNKCNFQINSEFFGNLERKLP
jgi:hypothetical protein